MSELDPITVDLNQWLTTKQNVEANWQDEQKRLQGALAAADREAKLEPKPAECSECGAMDRFYKDDYICFKCRDKMGN